MDSNRINRRWLLVLSGSSMVWVSLSGCGGGSDAAPSPADTAGPAPSPSPTPAPPSVPAPPPSASAFEGNGVAGAGSAGTPVAAAQRVAALDKVTAAMSALASANTGGPQFDAVALAQQLVSMPAFHRVGVSMRMANVWARFTDGRSLVVVNNLQPGPNAAGATPSAPAGPRARALNVRAAGLSDGPDLPALLVQTQYRQLDMLGAVPRSRAVEAVHLCQDGVDGSTLPSLCLMAMGRGLTLPPSQRSVPSDNSVEGLRDVSGDGVFFITACAAEVASFEAPTSVICTATPHNDANEARYAAELGSGALAYAISWRGAGTSWQPFKCLAITPTFPALAGWSFPTEYIGILNLTGGSVLAEWGSALRAAGLRNLFTWDKPVPWQRMLAFADDLLQIELGTNNFDGRAVRQQTPPRLRGYGVGATVEYLLNRRLADDAGGKGQAVYLPEPDPAGYASVLLPTIDYATINEDSIYIELVGQFGREQGLLKAPEVRVGSSLAAPPEPLLARADGLLAGEKAGLGVGWRGDGIQANLHRNQLARGGYAQVINGDRRSNAVQITFWEIPITVTSTITSELTLKMTVTLTLRADVRGYRLQPDGDRWSGSPMRYLGTSADSRAVFTASGEIAQTVGRDTTTISWSGSGSVAGVVLCTHPAVDGARVRLRRPLGLLAGSYANASEPVTLLGERTRTTTLSWGALPASYSPVEDAYGGV